MKRNWRMSLCGREVATEDVAIAVGLSQQELAREFATLRHMKILRGLRRGGKIYFALFVKKSWTTGEEHVLEEPFW